MNTEEKWQYVVSLDEKYLLGGVILSEWTSCITRDADTAFCNGANLSAILSAQAAIECHLRYEYDPTGHGFYQLIENSPLEPGLRNDLHALRRFRNRWVHVTDPQDDTDLLEQPDLNDGELEKTAFFAVELLRRVLYLEQWV